MTMQFFVEYGTETNKHKIELHTGPAGGDESCATMVHFIRCWEQVGDDVTLTSVTGQDYKLMLEFLRSKSALLIPQIVACFMKKNSWSATKMELMKL